MNGFFTRKETESVARPNGKALTCVTCGLYKTATTQKMEPYGNFRKGIMNIGEAPGEREDENGIPWQGKTGKMLKRMYEKLGIDLFEDCVNLNAVNCRPMDKEGDNRAPSNFELDCCRRIVLAAIEKYKPRIIVLFGTMAVYSVIGHRWKKDLGGITKWRGWVIPDQDMDAWVCPVFHPSFVERAETGDVQVIWEADLKRALAQLATPVPKLIVPRINILNEDLSILNKLEVPNRVVFDYETTGLKPHAQGHKIICCSVAISPDNCFVFMMPRSREARKPFYRLLSDPLIEKVAHNMKYEQTWTEVKLRTPVNNWYWDTMIAAHILDNRPGVCSLQFQVYVNFGVVDFKSETDQFLQSVEAKNGNSLNRIEELVSTTAGKELLLQRCAMDSIYEYRLAQKQIDLMDADLPF